jgi:hypothetical protein
MNETMHSLFHELLSIPGVLGACLVHKTQGCLWKESKEKVPSASLEKVSQDILRLFQMGTMSGISLKTSSFQFDRYALVALTLESEALLVLLCVPRADTPFIASRVHLLAKDYAPLLSLPQAVPESFPESITELEDLDEDEIVEEAPESQYPAALQALFDRLEKALAGAIGPVAGMVMQDYIDRWQQAGPPVTGRLVELTTMLVEEIGDPEAAQEFILKVEDLC